MSYVRIWVHLVFSTKNRHPYLTKNIRYKVFDHIKANCKEKFIFLQAFNGYTEHVHCLISLGREQSIAKVAQLINGESSHWINKHKLIDHFMWQDDYYAISVSESNVAAVTNYIRNQEQHHSKKTFIDEIKKYDEKHKFESSKDE